jgi:hypothetical protein
VILHAVVQRAQAVLVVRFVAAAEGMRHMMCVLQPDPVLAELDRTDIPVFGHELATNFRRHVPGVPCAVVTRRHGRTATLARVLLQEIVLMDVVAQRVLHGLARADRTVLLAGDQRLRTVEVCHAATREVDRACHGRLPRAQLLAAPVHRGAQLRGRAAPGPREDRLVAQGRALLVAGTQILVQQQRRDDGQGPDAHCAVQQHRLGRWARGENAAGGRVLAGFLRAVADPATVLADRRTAMEQVRRRGVHLREGPRAPDVLAPADHAALDEEPVHAVLPPGLGSRSGVT